MRDSAAIWQPSPNYQAGREGCIPKWLIIHGTAGPGAVSWFQNPASQVSAHYVIELDGSITCCVDEDDTAWANGVITDGHDPWWIPATNPNYVTISIEHTKLSPDNSDGLTQAQQAASFALIADICQRNTIAMRPADASGGITSHASIDPVNRARCPGTYPWTELWTFLKEKSMNTYGITSSDFGHWFAAQSDGNWKTLTNSNTVMGGNLALYQHLSIDGNTLPVIGLPRTSELYQKDANGYAWTVQFFERGLIVYDPQFKHDHQPGLGASYLGKYDQFKELDPDYKAGLVITKIPDNVIADIKALKSAGDKLLADVGL